MIVSFTLEETAILFSPSRKDAKDLTGEARSRATSVGGEM